MHNFLFISINYRHWTFLPGVSCAASEQELFWPFPDLLLSRGSLLADSVWSINISDIRLYWLPVLFVLSRPTSWSSRSASWWEVFNKYKSAPVGRSTSLRLAWLTHLRSGIVVNLLVCNVVSSVVSSLFCFCLIPPCLAWAWEHESEDKEEWSLQLRPVTELRIIFHG